MLDYLTWTIEYDNGQIIPESLSHQINDLQVSGESTAAPMSVVDTESSTFEDFKFASIFAITFQRYGYVPPIKLYCNIPHPTMPGMLPDALVPFNLDHLDVDVSNPDALPIFIFKSTIDNKIIKLSIGSTDDSHVWFVKEVTLEEGPSVGGISYIEVGEEADLAIYTEKLPFGQEQGELP